VFFSDLASSKRERQRERREEPYFDCQPKEETMY
jgi:hypothetical protein